MDDVQSTSDLSQDWYIVKANDIDGKPLTNREVGRSSATGSDDEPAVFPNRASIIRFISSVLKDPNFDIYAAQKRGGSSFKEYTAERQRAEHDAVYGRSARPPEGKRLSSKNIVDNNLSMFKKGDIFDIVDWNQVGKLVEDPSNAASIPNFKSKNIKADENYRAKLGREISGYEALRNIKMPLLLHYQDDPATASNQERSKKGLGPLPKGTPWTVEEVIKAMYPAVMFMARQYAQKRAGYQFEDAVSHGLEAVLRTLKTDKGIAPFAGYCFQRIRSHINRGARTSGVIKRPSNQKDWYDKGVVSMNVAAGGSADGGDPGEISQTIGAATKVLDYVDCPTCGGSKELDTGEKCPVCMGSGKVTQAVYRDKIYTDPRFSSDSGYFMDPSEIAQNKERVEQAMALWDRVLDGATGAGLSPKQNEVFRMKHGLDGTGVPKEFIEIVNVFKEKYGTGTQVGIKNLYKDAESKVKYVLDRNTELKSAIAKFGGKFLKTQLGACEKCDGEGTTLTREGKKITCTECGGEGFVDYAEMTESKKHANDKLFNEFLKRVENGLASESEIELYI